MGMSTSEKWLVVGLVVLFAGIASLAIASGVGAIPNTPGQAPVVLVHATPGLGR